MLLQLRAAGQPFNGCWRHILRRFGTTARHAGVSLSTHHLSYMQLPLHVTLPLHGLWPRAFQNQKCKVQNAHGFKCDKVQPNDEGDYWVQATGMLSECNASGAAAMPALLCGVKMVNTVMICAARHLNGFVLRCALMKDTCIL